MLSSYYIMRPIRDQMGVAGGVNNLQWLFTGTLVGMLLLNVPFAYLVKTLPRTPLHSDHLSLFCRQHSYCSRRFFIGPMREQTVWIGRIFFIWVSVFNLFVVSMFWQLNVDMFSPEQGKRLFGLIAAGATIGAIVGSSLTALPRAPCFADFSVVRRRGSAGNRGVHRRPLVAPVASAASRGRRRPRPTEPPIGGSIFAGITHAFGSRYLVNVSLFMLLFTITSTFLYFQQAGIVSHTYQRAWRANRVLRDRRPLRQFPDTRVQLFLTGRIVGCSASP